MNITVVRSSIAESESLATRGQIFGALFVGPLIAQGYAVSVSNIGPAESGKSTFGRAAVEALPPFFASYAYQIQRPSHEGASIDVVSASSAFRYRDFGPETVNPYETRPMNSFFDLKPRQELGEKDARYQVGLDLFEHPPVSHLANADVIAIMGRKCSEIRRIFSNHYFDKMENNIVGQGLNSSLELDGYSANINPRTPKILDEIRKMKVWTNTAQASSKDHTGAVVFILANRRPAFQQAFENFAQSLALQ